MALTLRYFDVYNGEWLQDSRGNDVVEVRGNTLLEALYPDLRDKLSACKFGDLVTPEDLLRHPDGHSLLFASNEQLIFGDADAAAKIQEIFPHDIDAGFRGVKDRIAYGSLLLGDCSGERSLNIVFVGDAGENTIDLADSEAYNAAIEQQQQWQRDGYLEFSTDSPTFLFAKTVPGTDVGTAELTPKELKEKIDLKVIPAASDGWDKLTILLVEDGPSDSPTPIGECGGILPSETAAAFAGDCFGRISAPLAERFGLNESAMQHRICLRNFGDRGDNLGVHKIGKGMVLPLEMGELPWNLPPGTPTPDLILPISSFKGGDKSTLKPGLYQCDTWIGEKERSKTGNISVTQLVPLFPGILKDICPRIEPKINELAQRQNNSLYLAAQYVENQEAIIDNALAEGKEVTKSALYPTIKAAVEANRGALLQTPPIAAELKDFARTRWSNLAQGKDTDITFEWAKILPSKHLKDGEIATTIAPKGEEILAFRSPLITPNGAYILKNNRNIPEYEQGKFENVIFISDAMHQRYLDGRQTVISTMGADFDGDTLAIAPAKSWPNLAADVRAHQANRLPEIVKSAKQEYADDTTLETAAINALGSPVGIISNSLTELYGQRAAIQILNDGGDEAKEVRLDYAEKILTNAVKISYKGQNTIPLKKIVDTAQNDEEAKSFSETFGRIEENFGQLVKMSREPLDDPKSTIVLGLQKQIIEDLIQFGGIQNQIAVDMFKSARVADADSFSQSVNTLIAHQQPWIRDKKSSLTFDKLSPTITGITPSEQLAALVSNYWQKAPIQSQEANRFHDLFPAEYTSAEKVAANAFTNDYTLLNRQLGQHFRKTKSERGPELVTTVNGRELVLTNISRFQSDLKSVFKPGQDIYLFSNNYIDSNGTERRRIQTEHTLVARIREGNSWKTIGTICPINAEEVWHKNPGENPIGKMGEYRLRSSILNVEALKNNRAQLINDFRANVPKERQEAMAAALWHNATAERNAKMNANAFTIYPEIVADRTRDKEFSYNLAILPDIDPEIKNKIDTAIQTEIEVRVNRVLQGESVFENLDVNIDGQWQPFLKQLPTLNTPLESETTGLGFIELAAPEVVHIVVGGESIPVGKVRAGDLADEIPPVAELEIRRAAVPGVRVTCDGKNIGNITEKHEIEFARTQTEPVEVSAHQSGKFTTLQWLRDDIPVQVKIPLSQGELPPTATVKFEPTQKQIIEVWATVGEETNKLGELTQKPARTWAENSGLIDAGRFSAEIQPQNNYYRLTYLSPPEREIPQLVPSIAIDGAEKFTALQLGVAACQLPTLVAELPKGLPGIEGSGTLVVVDDRKPLGDTFFAATGKLLPEPIDPQEISNPKVRAALHEANNAGFFAYVLPDKVMGTPWESKSPASVAPGVEIGTRQEADRDIGQPLARSFGQFYRAHQGTQTNMTEVATDFFARNPTMRREVERRGGSEWLLSCENHSPQFGGSGAESPLISALARGFEGSAVDRTFKTYLIDGGAREFLSPAGLMEELKLYPDRPSPTPLTFAGIEIGTQSEDLDFGRPFAQQIASAYMADRSQSIEDLAVRTFEEHPEWARAVAERGGMSWLETCSNSVGSNAGVGRESPFLEAIVKGYDRFMGDRASLTDLLVDVLSEFTTPEEPVTLPSESVEPTAQSKTSLLKPLVATKQSKISPEIPQSKPSQVEL